MFALFLGIWKIWWYKRKTIKLRANAGLPQLLDVNDLPDPVYDPSYVHVLTETEQKDLHRRRLLPTSCYVVFNPIPLEQRKFEHTQTWYRAHGTETHTVNYVNGIFLLHS